MKERKMTEAERYSLMAYRMDCAKEAIRTATDNIRDGHYNAAINRIYYGAFYALCALLLKDNYEFATHSGAKTLFGQYFIATGKIPRRYATIYGKLFNARNDSDYEAFIYFEEDMAISYLDEGKEFVLMIEEYLKDFLIECTN